MDLLKRSYPCFQGSVLRGNQTCTKLWLPFCVAFAYYFYRNSSMKLHFLPAGNRGKNVTRNGGPQIGACLILSDCPGDRFTKMPGIATALASYRIEKPRNPENRKTNWQKKGLSIFGLFFLQFFPYSSYFLPICPPSFWISGFFYSVAGRRNRKPGRARGVDVSWGKGFQMNEVGLERGC